MSVNVGIIGTGWIGGVHADTLTTAISGARVTAVTDVDGDRAAEVANEVGAAVVATSEELIRRDDVDAVLITTPAFTHAEIVLDAISVGKPMMCEKPLATSPEDAIRIMEAEMAHGTRLLQLGFMRRFDPGYREVKAAMDGGDIGVPLLAHMLHRNPEAPDGFIDEMVIRDSAVHDVDCTRWLFGEEIASVRLLQGAVTPNAQEGLHDPQVIVLQTESGRLSFVESYVTNTFGYDVRCEIVGSAGTAELATPRLSRLTGPAAVSEKIPMSFPERFAESFRLELQAWIHSIGDGVPVGANSWDGYASALVADAGVAAITRDGAPVKVTMIDRPGFYA